MTKQRINVSIDSELLKKAKMEIPNLSGFLEECLKHYLGLTDGTIPVAKEFELLDRIGKLQVEMYIMNEKNDVEELMNKAKNNEKDKAWRFLWNDYRQRLIPDEILMKKAIEQLGKNKEELEDILDWAYMTDVQVDTNSWQEVLRKYNKYGTNEF